MRIAGVVLIVAAVAVAQDKALTPEQAAKAVIEAKDAAVLKSLAEKYDPDPWLVADLLCAQGKYDAALAFAKAAPRKDVEKLPGYVESQRGKPDSAAGRKAFADARRAFRAKDFEAALAVLQAADTSAADVVSARLLFGRGSALRLLERPSESARAYEAAAKFAVDLGWLRRASGALEGVAMRAYNRSDWRGALAGYERLLALGEIRGDRIGVARAIGIIGIIHDHLGASPKALSYLKRALKLHGDLGDRAMAAWALNAMGNIHQGLGAYPAALSCQERALKLYEALRDGDGLGKALIRIANIHMNRGAYPKALAAYERALELAEERTDRGAMAVALGNIGAVHEILGAHSKALSYQERSLKLTEGMGDGAGMAATLVNIGGIHESLGAYTKAVAHYERALRLAVKLGDRASVATTLGSLGNVHERLGTYTKALTYQERALKLYEALGDHAGVVGSLAGIGNIHQSLGAYRQALSCQERARAMASDLGLLNEEVLILWNLSSTHLSLKKPAEAAKAARLGVEGLRTLFEGLADEQGATARDRWSGLLVNGISAGFALRDADEVLYFLESGRAGALLASLKRRGAIARASIPEKLRKDETAARAAILAAQAQLDRALVAGARKDIKQAHSQLVAARGAMLDVVERIQRSAKAAADVIYPKAAKLEQIQVSLDTEEALVLYALMPNYAVALVVTGKDARTVILGRVEGIRSALDKLVLHVPKSDSRATLDSLRRRLIEPLGLASTVKRVLISPDKRLTYLPFALLLGNRDVVYVPSGTTYGVLRDERGKRGKGVLALGDPDYGARVDTATASVSNRGHTLVPLPGTRAEAKAVGDVVLLGRDANETGLREALKKRERWRSVHFACHGLMDLERPLLSSLALSAGDDGDRFLTTLDVFQMKLAADLVVLSACETGKGKIYESEGIVGFTRAFMFAGAPRVIVSLWKVDDQASHALMTKFYELWKGGKMDTATALKNAQEFVRGHERWKHPYYWAAWQLWGLGD